MSEQNNFGDTPVSQTVPLEPARGQRPGDEPMPVVHEDQPCIQDLVIEYLYSHDTTVATLVAHDVNKRKAIGIERYGTTLQPFNGRRAYVDAYQEVLDLLTYIYQEMYEAHERGDAARYIRWKRYLQQSCDLAIEIRMEQ